MQNVGGFGGVGWVIGLAAALLAAGESRAQTYYYYYPSSSAPAAPAVTAPATPAAPAGYTIEYYRTWFGGQRYRMVYAPVTTQPAAETASSQPAKGEPTPAGVKLVETGYVAPEAKADAAKTDGKKADGKKAETAKEGETTGDPYGFTTWLNATRAAYGLPAVGYDPNLTNWAAANNEQQAARGMGHFVMGPARRQNAAMGGYPGVETMWMNSPAHRAALLDPTIRWIGIAGLGAYWTFNAN